jgi:hypothetical protein
VFGPAFAAEGGGLIEDRTMKSSHCKIFLDDFSGANTPVVELVQFCKSQRHGNLARAALFSRFG